MLKRLVTIGTTTGLCFFAGRENADLNQSYYDLKSEKEMGLKMTSNICSQGVATGVFSDLFFRAVTTPDKFWGFHSLNCLYTSRHMLAHMVLEDIWLFQMN